ncbi:uncharacterized protein LOC136085885 [Hydra vulgaris]|uniref:uncharacterized protein LOC136085885 n=1 Tax=Hydra vulgaris TaxID=6087 RepID=UPI0032EA1CDB
MFSTFAICLAIFINRKYEGSGRKRGNLSMNSLLKLGRGTLLLKADGPFRGCIEIPEQCLLAANGSIVDKIFGVAEEDDYAKHAILTPTNVDCLAINEEALDRLPDDLNEINDFPVEFLNSLTSSGITIHCLKLKTGAVIMLLRNLFLKAELCNGTRLMVRTLQNNNIDGQVLTVVSVGKRVFVPRVQLTQSDSNLSFTLKRRQFPVRL